MNIDKLLDNISNVIVEDIREVKVNQSEMANKIPATELVDAISELIKTVKRFNESTGNLKPQNPAGYSKALQGVKKAMAVAEADPDFIKPDVSSWNFLKKEVEHGMFPTNTEDEKAALKFYASLNGKIRAANGITPKDAIDGPGRITKDLVPNDKAKRAATRPAVRRAIENLANTDTSRKYVAGTDKTFASDDKRFKDLENEHKAKADALEKREMDLRSGAAQNQDKVAGQKVNQVLSRESKQEKYQRKEEFVNQQTSNNISSFKEAPVDGYDSLAKLVKGWKDSGKEPAGQIKVVATDKSGIGTGAGKPVLEINGKLYACGRKFLLQKQYGGYFCKPSDDFNNPYYGYFKDVRKDPAYDAIRSKIKGTMNESVQYFNY